jgi:hypothetical protein
MRPPLTHSAASPVLDLRYALVVKGREVGVKNEIPEQNVVVYQLA